MPYRKAANFIASAAAVGPGDAEVQFRLLNGLRHSEMNLIPKSGFDWEARQVRIRQGKAGNSKSPVLLDHHRRRT